MDDEDNVLFCHWKSRTKNIYPNTSVIIRQGVDRADTFWAR